MRPKVYGYIRSSRFDPAKLARLQRELEAYAEREDLTLSYVFTDNGVASTALERPGLNALLDVLSHPSAYGVVRAWKEITGALIYSGAGAMV